MPGKSKKGGGLESSPVYKMKYQGNPSAFPFKSSPMKATGSPEEKITKKDVKEKRTYTVEAGKDKGVVKSASMVNLEKNKPPTDSPNYASWKKAYDAAKAKHIASQAS